MASPNPWTKEAWRRLARLPWLKALGIPAFVALFFAGYFAVALHPLLPVHLVPELPIDRVIGFHADWIWIYCSLWVYASLPASLSNDRTSLIRCGGSAGLLAVAGLTSFLLWPTRVLPGGVGFLRSADGGSNACPSLHVAFVLWAAFRLDGVLRDLCPVRNKGIRTVNIAWCMAIVYSTMATKQHMFIDVLFGGALGVLAAVCDRIFFLEKKTPKTAVSPSRLSTAS